MDPAIQALTIRPSDWAALLDGFVEGLSYELVLLICIAALGAALFSILDRRGVSTERAVSGERVGDETTGPVWQPTLLGSAWAQPASGVILVASGPYAVRLERRQQQCARRRVNRRAAAVSFGRLPS